MALAVDGFSVLKQIGTHAELFDDIRADVNKQAVALLLKQIAKSDLAKLRRIYRAVGADNFRKAADNLKSAGPTVKRLDKHNPDHKTMSASDQRALLDALAREDAEPYDKPVRTKPAAKSAKKISKKISKKSVKKEKGIMEWESMKAREK